MPATVLHVFTSPVADGTNTQLVRPSNWNSGHLMTLAPSGAEMIGGLSNANNVSFATETNGFITATASFPAQTLQPAVAQLNGSSGTMSLAVGSSLSASTNGSTITFGLASNITTALQSAGAYLTTARASNDAVGLNTAFTAGPLAWTVNSAGLSLNAGSAAGTTSGFTGGASISGSMTHNTAGLAVSLSHPAWITTAAQSGHSHGNPTLNLTNLSGTTASASNGFTLSLSAAATVAQTNQTGNFYVQGNTTQLSSTAGIDLRSISFEGAGIASVGVSNGRVLVSVPSGGGAGDGVNIVQMEAAGNSAGATFSASTGTVYLRGGNNITLSQTSNTIIFSGGAGGGGATRSIYEPYNEVVGLIGQVGQGTLNFDPVWFPDLHIDRLALPVNYLNTSNSSGSLTVSFWVGMYSKNVSTMSLAYSTSITLGVTNSGTVGSYSLVSAYRNVTIPWTTTITQGDYYLGVLSRTTTGGAAGMSMSQLVGSQINSNFQGIFGVSQNNSMQPVLGAGYYSATTSSLPGSIGFTALIGSAALAQRPPFVAFLNGTV